MDDGKALERTTVGKGGLTSDRCDQSYADKESVFHDRKGGVSFQIVNLVLALPLPVFGF